MTSCSTPRWPRPRPWKRSRRMPTGPPRTGSTTARSRRSAPAVREQGRVAVFMGDRLNRIAQLKPAMYLRGVEQILLDMSLRPEIARAIFRRIRDFYYAYAERILEAARGQLDLVLTGDDFGTQNGTAGLAAHVGRFAGRWLWASTSASPRAMASASCTTPAARCAPGAADGRARPGRAAIATARGHRDGSGGLKGRVRRSALVPRRHLHPTHPALWQARGCARGGARADRGPGPGGGYILCTSHNIQADTPVENVLALLQAYHDYGRRGHTL